MWQGSTHQFSADVQPDELLTSFVFRPEQINKNTKTIQPSRIVPRRNTTNKRLETSVCRSSRLTEAQVWNIGLVHFDAYAPKPAIGRGVGPASVVFAENLEFDPDGKPYPEHANIIGWQDDADKPDNELKHFWMDQHNEWPRNFCTCLALDQHLHRIFIF